MRPRIQKLPIAHNRKKWCHQHRTFNTLEMPAEWDLFRLIWSLIQKIFPSNPEKIPIKLVAFPQKCCKFVFKTATMIYALCGHF